jgi:hypothetical protein
MGPVVPAKWELFLRELNLSDSGALEAISYPPPNETGTRIKNWVNRNYRNVFVPEIILQTMGIETGFDA